MAMMNVPITKAKTTLELDLDKIPEDVFQEVVLQGLKVLLNRGASKVTKAAFAGDEEAMKAEALVVAQKQLEMVMTSKIKFTGGKAKKASGAVMTEARRLAKIMIKDAIKAQGHKIAHYEPKEITAFANELLASEEGTEILKQAEINLQERAKAPIAIDITTKLRESPKLVARAEKAKAEKKSQLSAKQAGKPKTRAKGEAHHANA